MKFNSLTLTNGDLNFTVNLSNFKNNVEFLNFLLKNIKCDLNQLTVFDDINEQSPYTGLSVDKIFEKYEILSKYDTNFLKAYERNFNDIAVLSVNELSHLENFLFFEKSPKEVAELIISEREYYNGSEIPSELLKYLDYEKIADEMLESGELIEDKNGCLLALVY